MQWRMFVGLAVALVSVASLCGQTQEIQDKVNETLKLQGRWVFHSATLLGKPAQIANKFDLVFSKDKVVIVSAREGKEHKTAPLAYEFDLKKKPKVLIIHTSSDQKGEKEKVKTTQKAIYEVDGDSMKFAPAAGPNQEPPTSFDDERSLVIKFRREKLLKRSQIELP